MSQTVARPGWRSIRFRIVAAFIGALAMSLMAPAWLVGQQQQITQSLTLVTKGYLPEAKIVARLQHDQERVENDVQRLLRGEARPFSGSSSATQLYTEEMQRTLGEGRIHADFARRLATSTEEKVVFNRIDSQLGVIDQRFRDWQSQVADFVQRAEAGDAAGAAALRPELARQATTLGDEIDTLGRLVDGRVSDVTRATERAQSRATAISAALVVGGLALGLTLVAAVLVALRPVGRLTTEVQRLAAGDYTGRVEVEGKDEIAILATEFNRMVIALEARDRALVDRAKQLDRLSRYLGSVLDGLEDGLFVEEDSTVTLANPAAERIWGIHAGVKAPPELIDLTPGRHEVARDGALFEIRVVPFGEQGRLTVAADVTEPTRTRERLVRSERLALVGQMLAQVTHEVRNPLNALSLNAELLGDELAELDGEHKTEAWALLGTVSSEIERLTQVTAHYLQLARRPRAHHAPEDIAGLVEDVVRLLAAELAQEGVKLDLHLAPVGLQSVDGNQLKQALLNIIRNAMEAGAHHLSLSVALTDGEIRLILTDDGPGMSEDDVAKVCEPFWSTKATGTGLGLAITKQILEDHDGAVRVRSALGAGSTFELAFPERPV